jgi:hypothetical protein
VVIGVGRGLISFWDLAEKKRCLLFTSEYAVAEAKRNLLTVDQLKRLETYVSKVRIAPEVNLSGPTHSARWLIENIGSLKTDSS